jgi:uncharacterized protein
MEPGTLLFLLAAAFVAAFVDSIVGGGGIISLPALLATGMDPHVALGTNKLAATGASSMATIRYTQAGLVVLPLALALIPFSVVGAMLGSRIVLEFDDRFVKGLVIVVMVAMTLYVLARKRFGAENRFGGATARAVAIGAVVALAVGFYDGFLGPGTGTFLIFAFVGLLRFDFVRAAAHGRVLNFASNLSALVLFALHGRVDYLVGLPMMAAMLVGAYIGSHVGMRHGARWIKPLFVAVSAGLLLRLLWLLLMEP